VAVTVQLEGDVQQQLEELEDNNDVIAVTQVVRRSISAYPNPPDDPVFPPDNSFSSSYQWYLNQPDGNYGIDILRAWGYMDSQEVNYGGDSDVVVAVIDSGVAYENHTKYPDDWVFGRSPDLTNNIYVNSGETANNDLDDDSNGEVNVHYRVSASVPNYCVDLNENGQCNSPAETTKNYFDDRNGFNTVDFEKYWYISSSNVNTSPNCSDLPSFKCVLPSQTECELSNQPLDYGCEPGDMGHANDTMGHGTFVSNVIAAKTDNSMSGAGIAPGVTILPIQIFSATYAGSGSNWFVDGGFSDQIARAVNYAVDAGADVINMSFGGSAPDVYEELAMDAAYFDDDVVLVAASGNTSNSVVQYPAGYDSVIAVGAVNMNGSRTSYSSYGPHLELSAPVGSGIMNESYECYLTAGMWDNDGGGEACMASDTIGDMDPADGDFPPDIMTSFSTWTSAGTSFAAPQVAAVAALVKSLYPTWDAEQIRYVLRMSSNRVGSSRYSESIGYGVLSAYNAVRAVDQDDNDLSVRKRIFQTMRGTNNSANLRYSDDHGTFWSDWVASGSAHAPISLLEHSNSGRVLEAKRGHGSKVYTRYSSNFGDSWSSWVEGGSTSGSVEMVTTGVRIFQAIRGYNTGALHTRYSDNGGSSWTSWDRSINITGSVTMVYHQSTGHLIQAVRRSDGKVYTKYSDDNGVSWHSWYANGNSSSDIAMISAGTRVIQAIRGKNTGKVHTRYSTDGGASWSGWQTSVSTSDKPELLATGARVIQTARGTGDEILTRYSTDGGSSWSSWVNSGRTLGPITMTYDEPFSRIFQSIWGKTYFTVHTRYSDDGGDSWSNWDKSDGTKDAVGMIDATTATWE
jgi:hypothetical protein